jgi:hypothetical protein
LPPQIQVEKEILNFTAQMAKFLSKLTSKSFYSYIVFLLLAFTTASAQSPVEIQDTVDQHIFTYNEIEVLKDASGKLTLQDIRQKNVDKQFRASLSSTPQTLDLNTNYWFKIKIKSNSAASKHYILEFFDQTIDHITAYIPSGNNSYEEKQLGDSYEFSRRELLHKNFEIPITNVGNEVNTYYVRIRSSQISDAIIVLRSVNWFIAYALNEYFFFGIFYGMIFVFSLYNLIMYSAMRQKQYLFYVLYILSVGFYEMSTDGIAYQYLWPNLPAWNQIAYAFALCASSVFALLFTRQLLHVKTKAPRLNTLIIRLIQLRLAFFLYCLVFNQNLFNYKFIESIPLSLAFFTGIYIYQRGYKAARFFVLGYSVLFIAFTLKFLIMLGYGALNFGAFSYYSLSFSFIVEMIFFSFAIADQFSILKVRRERVHKRMIAQLADTSRLKDSLNKELESKVQERTKEVFHKSLIIEAKNDELLKANDLLKQQAEEISRMNVLLEQDNQELQTSVEKVTRDRVMSADVDYEEFSRIYPDKESCNLFLADLKWKNGYACRKCKNTQYYPGHVQYSRRCSKCGYEESVTSYSIFHNTRIPINKAFYMVFLIYNTKGKISSHKLSEILNLRQSTCWTYGARIKEVMEERKTVLKKKNVNGWSELVLD